MKEHEQLIALIEALKKTGQEATIKGSLHPEEGLFVDVEIKVRANKPFEPVARPRIGETEQVDIDIDFAKNYALKSGRDRGVTFDKLAVDRLQYYAENGYDETTRKCAQLILDSLDSEQDDVPPWLEGLV